MVGGETLYITHKREYLVTNTQRIYFAQLRHHQENIVWSFYNVRNILKSLLPQNVIFKVLTYSHRPYRFSSLVVGLVAQVNVYYIRSAPLVSIKCQCSLITLY